MKKCKHIWDSEELNPKCHKCKKLMREDKLKKYLTNKGFPNLAKILEPAETPYKELENKSIKKLSNEEAETMMSNVAMYVLKNKLNKGL